MATDPTDPTPPADEPPPLSPEGQAAAEITEDDLDDAEAYWKQHAGEDGKGLIDAEPEPEPEQQRLADERA